MAINLSKVRPLSDYLLIEPAQKETTLPSGIVIPDTVKEKPMEGKVLAVGTGRRDEKGDRIPMDVKVGDMVMFKKQWGESGIKIDGKEMLLIKEDDVLAVVEN